MKKIVGLLMCLALLIGLLVPVTSVSAYTGGYLNGKTLKVVSGNPPFSGGTNVTVATDNDESTYTVLNGGNHLYYMFPEDVTITGYRIKTSNAAQLYWINSNNSEIWIADTVFNGSVVTLSTPITGAKGIELYQNAGSNNIYEFDIFISAPADTTPPVTPLNLQVTPGDSQVNLNWSSNTESDLAGYKVYKNGVYLETVAAPVATYTATGLTNGTTYMFEVAAIDSSGNESTKSNAVQVTPQAPVVGRAILTISMTNGSEKEYDLAMTEVNAFISWYDAKDAGSGPAKYKFVKTWNKGPFKVRSEYVIFDKILTFDVDEYDVVTP